MKKSLILLSIIVLTACNDNDDEQNQQPIVDTTPPSLSAVSDIAIDAYSENNVITLELSDDMTSLADLSLSAASSNSQVISDDGIAISNTEVSLTPVPDVIGSAVITITATDSSGNSSSVDINVQVNAVQIEASSLIRAVFENPAQSEPELINGLEILLDSDNENQFDDLLG
ncbi:MAG: hypothetical protein ACFHVJ_01945 [Aestuariibacter sp.]